MPCVPREDRYKNNSTIDELQFCHFLSQCFFIFSNTYRCSTGCSTNVIITNSNSCPLSNSDSNLIEGRIAAGVPSAASGFEGRIAEGGGPAAGSGFEGRIAAGVPLRPRVSRDSPSSMIQYRRHIQLSHQNSSESNHYLSKIHLRFDLLCAWENMSNQPMVSVRGTCNVIWWSCLLAV